MLNEFKQIKDDTFKRLKDNIGKEVTCRFYLYGVENEVTGTLYDVDFYDNIFMSSGTFKFIGYGNAIYYIVLNDTQEVLYFNPFAYEYDARSKSEINTYRASTFGLDLVRKKIQRNEYKKFLFEEEEKTVSKRVKLHSCLLKNEGLKYVKAGRKEEWKEYVKANTENAYSASIVESVIQMMKLFEKGASFEDAEKIVCTNLNLTLYMAKCMANALIYFSKYGEEFGDYWKKQCGVNEAKEQELTLN